MDRREFLRCSMMLAAGTAVSLEFPAFAKVLRSKGTANLKIGILSDIHIRNCASFFSPNNADTFRHTLEWFRDQGVDGVLIAGDMADWGLKEQLAEVAGAWNEVFPGGVGLGGKHVEKLFIYGNHDVNTWARVKNKFASEEEWAAAAINPDRKAVWESLMGEPYEPIYLKNINGYSFVGAHWCDGGAIDGLAEFLQAHDSELRGKKPFFFFQHPHPKGTCNGSWAWGQDNGTVTSLLNGYHNCIAFSGHSHHPLTDDRDLWQEGFTSIGTASLRYLYPAGARENTHIDGKPQEHSEMMETELYEGRHGMLMYVYDDCVAFEKREFVHDEALGDNWIIPIGAKGAPMSFENRAKDAAVPQFNGTDGITVTKALGKDRAGDEHMQVTVHFPSVLKKTHGVRAFDYEVCVECKAQDLEWTALTRRVYSSKFFLGEEHDGGEVTCVFAESALPSDFSYRFAVRPCECFGSKGSAIYSEWV